ncbi:MAG: hypothetical protein QW667_04115 [Candidatus Bathyarchaeia archaeon]
MKKWQISLLVTIIIFIIGLAGAGWSQRPIIDYYMDGLEDNFTFRGYPMTINLKYRNRGSIDASLKLVVTTINANITVDKTEPWIEYNETQVKFNVAAISHMDVYASHSVNIYPVGNPHNFTIKYTIEDSSNYWSINGVISHLFLESHGYFPTYVVYNRTDTNTYEWIK